MTTQPGYQHGDRVALVRTDDPCTRLRPGDQGTVTRWNPRQGQLDVTWDSGSTLSMLPGEGDQIRLIARAASEDGTDHEDPEDPGAGEPSPERKQDITDPATGLSRLLSERCPTCILRAGDPMHLGPERLRAIIGGALAAGSFVVCHDTLTYGDFPDYGPAICRGFFDAYAGQSPALIFLQAFQRLTETPPPGLGTPAPSERRQPGHPGSPAAGRRAPGIPLRDGSNAEAPGDEPPPAPGSRY